MLCREKCPRGKECNPLSNVVSDKNETFVCIGYNNELKEDAPKDEFRHCFKSLHTDTMLDYDEYDLKSVISVMSEALLINELNKKLCI